VQQFNIILLQHFKTIYFTYVDALGLTMQRSTYSIGRVGRDINPRFGRVEPKYSDGFLLAVQQNK